MPEIGYDEYVPDPQQPNEQREDHLVRVPRSAIRNLESKAKALDGLMAAQVQADQDGVPLDYG